MNLLGGLKIALRALTGNKMRTALTMLGMMIGVAVVIVVVAIGEGATKRVTDTVNSLGTNFLSVSTNRNRLRVGTAISRTSISVSGAITASNTVAPNRLTVEDGRVIASRFSQSIEAVAPQNRFGGSGANGRGGREHRTHRNHARLSACQKRRD